LDRLSRHCAGHAVVCGLWGPIRIFWKIRPSMPTICSARQAGRSWPSTCRYRRPPRKCVTRPPERHRLCGAALTYIAKALDLVGSRRDHRQKRNAAVIRSTISPKVSRLGRAVLQGLVPAINTRDDVLAALDKVARTTARISSRRAFRPRTVRTLAALEGSGWGGRFTRTQ